MQADTESFRPTIDELEALKRFELETLTVSTAIHDHIPHRLYDLGYIVKNAEGRLTLTAKGLALAHRQ